MVCASVSLFVIGASGSALAEPFFEGYVGKFVVASPPEQAPDIPFPDVDGVEHRLSDYGGRVVLLNFWATWCPACVMELPALERLQRKLGGDGFTVLAMSQDATAPPAVSSFLRSRGLNTLPVFFDDQRRLGVALDQHMLPTSILLDAKGREVGRLVGPAEWDSREAVALIRSFMRRNEYDSTRAQPRSPNTAVSARRLQHAEATSAHDAGH
ncbi:MAG: TlpA family protein disulfide reductase [Acidobacteriota bacterium]